VGEAILEAVVRQHHDHRILGDVREHVPDDVVHELVVATDHRTQAEILVLRRVSGRVPERPGQVMREVHGAEVHPEEPPVRIPGEKIDRDVSCAQISGEVEAHLFHETLVPIRPSLPRFGGEIFCVHELAHPIERHVLLGHDMPAKRGGERLGRDHARDALAFMYLKVKAIRDRHSGKRPRRPAHVPPDLCRGDSRLGGRFEH
jgi:hypothetical protein